MTDWPEWNQDIERKRAMNALPPPPVAWRIDPLDRGIKSYGSRPVTSLPQQRDIWVKEGWDVEPLCAAEAVEQAIEPLRQRIAELEAQLASGQEPTPNSPEFIAAYMGFCKDKAPDHNEIGLAYFGAGWRAKASQPIASGQEPVGEREAFEAWWEQFSSDHEEWRHADSHALRWQAWQARATHPAPTQQPLSDEWIAAFAKRGKDLDTRGWTDNDIAEWVTRQVEAAQGTKEKS
jgi:hypothetical protein